MNAPVSIAAHIVAGMRERIKAETGLEDGDPWLEGSLEGATDLPEMLASMARKRRRLQGFSKACREQANEALAAAAMYERQGDALVKAMTFAMIESGMTKLPREVSPDLIVYTNPGVSTVDIPDEDAVPRPFCDLKETWTPIKSLIKGKLEAGEQFNWATLTEPKPFLTIRKRS